jgi:hypothetical protein
VSDQLDQWYGSISKSATGMDPNGKAQHDPGAKLDDGKNRLGLVLGSFSRALEEVGCVGTYGANKYTPNGWLTVPNGVERYTDAMYRHLLREAQGQELDEESGLRHAAQVAWNALARLELMLRGQIVTRDAEAKIEPVGRETRPWRIELY